MALLLALLCGVAIVVVLIEADDLSLNGWQVSRNDVQSVVLISISATVANALFRFAFTEAGKPYPGGLDRYKAPMHGSYINVGLTDRAVSQHFGLKESRFHRHRQLFDR